MTRYVAQVERTPDGSLLTAIYRDHAAVHVEPVRAGGLFCWPLECGGSGCRQEGVNFGSERNVDALPVTGAVGRPGN